MTDAPTLPALPNLAQLEGFAQNAAPVLEPILAGLSLDPKLAPFAAVLKLIVPAIEAALTAGKQIQETSGATPDAAVIHQFVASELTKIGSMFHNIAATFHPPQASA